MPFRAFGDSDGRVLAVNSGLVGPVSMPFRAFGDSDEKLYYIVLDWTEYVSMPFRAFGDSDRRPKYLPVTTRPLFQCPFGHSGILTPLLRTGKHVADEFQCPFGHSGILTCTRAVQEVRHLGGVSMPFRAFGDSDPVPAAGLATVPEEFQCPFGHSGILTKQALEPSACNRVMGFNALSGIRGF